MFLVHVSIYFNILHSPKKLPPFRKYEKNLLEKIDTSNWDFKLATTLMEYIKNVLLYKKKLKKSPKVGC